MYNCLLSVNRSLALAPSVLFCFRKLGNELKVFLTLILLIVSLLISLLAPPIFWYPHISPCPQTHLSAVFCFNLGNTCSAAEQMPNCLPPVYLPPPPLPPCLCSVHPFPGREARLPFFLICLQLFPQVLSVLNKPSSSTCMLVVKQRLSQ